MQFNPASNTCWTGITCRLSSALISNKRLLFGVGGSRLSDKSVGSNCVWPAKLENSTHSFQNKLNIGQLNLMRKKRSYHQRYKHWELRMELWNQNSTIMRGLKAQLFFFRYFRFSVSRCVYWVLLHVWHRRRGTLAN